MRIERSRFFRPLFTLLGILVGLAAGARADETLVRAGDDPNSWPMYGRTYDNSRFSPLAGINTRNASAIKLAFAFELGSLRSNESTPIVIGDTLYVSTSWGPKYVYALDAATGERRWTYEPEIPDDVLQYACCDVNNRGVAYGDGKIFVGRLDGKLAALDAKTGKELWVAQVVDYKQGSVITSPPLVVKNKVITGFGGGEYGARGSLQAYDVDTGKEVWKTWTVPGPGEEGNDTWKGDSWQHGGGTAWLVLKADRNGFFYVVNRETGKLISAEKFVFANWAERVDLKAARPVELPEKRPGLGHPAKDICPNLIGGKNWQPMSFNPQTGLVYIPSNNICMDWSVGEVNYRRGVFYLGAEFPTHAGPGGYMGEMVAWNPVTQKKVWGIKEDLPFNGGTLSTGGGLLFYGNLHGMFRAVDARTGKVLWEVRLGSGIGAGPMTYSVGGKQYVAVVVGRTAAIPAFLGDIGKQMVAATPEGGALYVFTH
jgi:glucose dehydrogenase